MITLARVAAIIRRIIGVPDYDAYLAHARKCHPERAPMTNAEFQRDTLVRRYSTPGNRCC
ncbi:MAG: YbdD/YjiX family protein [Gemmatimonadota bacterium]